MKICGIYSIKCRESHKLYIGSSVNVHQRWRTHRSELRRATHHSPYLQHAWNKYGVDAFDWAVLCLVDDPRVLHEVETYYMRLFRSTDPDYGYNQAPVGGSCLGFRHGEESRKRMSESQKKVPYEHRLTYCRSWVGRQHTDETKAKMSANSKRTSPSPEQRLAISKVHAGKVISAEHRAAVGKATAAKNKTPEMRAKVSAALTGRKFSPEHIAKLSASRKGRAISEEHRQKLREALKGRTFTPEHLAKIKATKDAKKALAKHGQVEPRPLNLSVVTVIDD